MGLAPDKIEIKREMLSLYQLKIADLYNISIANVQNLVPNSFDKEKYMTYYQNLQRYLRLSLKFKKKYLALEFNLSMAKTICWIQDTKRTEAENNDGKVLHKLLNNAVYGKTMENLESIESNRINEKLVSNKKDYSFKMDIQTKLYVTQNAWQWFSGDMKTKLH